MVRDLSKGTRRRLANALATGVSASHVCGSDGGAATATGVSGNPKPIGCGEGCGRPRGNPNPALVRGICPVGRIL